MLVGIIIGILVVLIIAVLIYLIPYRNIKIVQQKLDRIIDLLEKK